MLRPYVPADEDALIRVWLASTIPGQDFLPEEHWRSMEPEIRALMPVAATWIIEDDGEIVAFVSLLDNLIGGLFTAPGHQGKGHGRALVEHARTLHETVLVEVFQDNEKALAFYRRCGFVDFEEETHEASGLPILILRIDGLGGGEACSAT